MNEPKRTYEIALKCAFQDGAEKVANPTHPDCTIANAKYNFAYYCNVDKFSDLTTEQQKDFWTEYIKGKAAEEKYI